MPPEIVDFEFACACIEDTDYFAQICFHFQQAAEKYLKAFIIANKLQFRPVASLIRFISIPATPFTGLSITTGRSP